MIKRNSRKGFTIIELVIVIAVIVVLAAVLIPTFASIIDKANESADVQLVRQMNTILKAEETVDGKPANVDEVKAILTKNGIGDFVPALAEHAFAWDSENNVVVLMNKETATGVFPKEYEGVAYDSATWVVFGGTVNVSMEDLGASLNEALKNVEFGQTIVLSSDQTLGADVLPSYVNIDLGGHKLTLNNGLPMEANANITLSNGDVKSARIDVADGATLTLNDIDITFDGEAIVPSRASHIDINGGSILANVPIATNYSDGWCRDVVLNMRGTTLGNNENPCAIGVMLIISGDTTISNCTIYATVAGILDRAGNVTVKNTVINYSPNADFSDTYFGSVSAETTYNGKTPGSVRQMMWNSGSGGFAAPIVVGDFWAKHYSFDANCTLVNVTVNSTNETYPDVYLSQENYDIFLNADPNNRVAGTEEIVKTTLTCDNTITWMVNPGKNDAFVDDCVDGMEHFATYSGFGYSGSGYGGVAALYVDNVFVNGTEQAPGSTSENPVTAGDIAVKIPAFVGSLAAGEHSVSELNKNYPIDSTIETYDYTAEVIAALADSTNGIGVTLSKDELLSSTLHFGSTKNCLKFVTYTKDGTTTKAQVKISGGRLEIPAIAGLALTGDQSGSVLVKTIDTVSYLDVFKSYCAVHGITLTDSSKIVVGANNTIIGVK